MEEPPAPAAPVHPLVQRYLEHVRFEKRLAPRTVTLYELHLADLQQRAAEVPVEVLQVHQAHVRRWAAQLHARGRSGHGIALVLSCWRGFYAWLGREGLVVSNPVQDVRAPRAGKALPKALGVDDAVQLADFEAEDEDPWLEARDAAMVELLYGCGLRVGELVGLDIQASAAALQAGRGWIDLEAAEVQVQGKGSKRRTAPLGRPAQAAARPSAPPQARPSEPRADSPPQKTPKPQPPSQPEPQQKPQPKPQPKPAPSANSKWGVQIGSFGGKDGAEAVKQQAAKAGYSSVISSAAVGGKTFFRVTVPAGNDRAGAENMAARLKNSGFPVLVVGMN